MANEFNYSVKLGGQTVDIVSPRELSALEQHQEALQILRMERDTPQPVEEPQTGPGLIERVSGLLKQGRAALQPGANNLVNLAGEVLTGDTEALGRRLQAPMGLQAPEEFQQAPQSTVGQIAAETLNPMPGSLTEAAIAAPLAAAGPIGRAVAGSAPGIAPGLARAGARIAAPAAAGAVAGGVETGDPLMGAAKGAVAGAAGEVVRGGLAASAKMKTRVTPAKVRAWSSADAGPLSRAVGDEVPAFKKIAISTEDGLYSLRDPNVGKKALKDQFSRVDTAIEGHFGTQDIVIPKLSTPSREAYQVAKLLGLDDAEHPLVQQTLQQNGMPLYNPMKVKQALDALKLLKAQAREVNDDAIGFQLRQKARDAEASFVGMFPPALQTQYAKAVREFDKGLDVLEIFQKSGMFEGDTKGPVLAMDKMRKFLAENPEKYPPSEWRHLIGAVTRGGRPGAKDVDTLMSGDRFYVPTPGLGRIGVSTPKMTFRQRVGAPVPPPRDLPPAATSILGLRSMEQLLGGGPE